MTDPKTPAATTDAAATTPVVKTPPTDAAAKPDRVKVIANHSPIPHAYEVSTRISNVHATSVPNDSWTQVQIDAKVLRLAE